MTKNAERGITTYSTETLEDTTTPLSVLSRDVTSRYGRNRKNTIDSTDQRETRRTMERINPTIILTDDTLVPTLFLILDRMGNPVPTRDYCLQEKDHPVLLVNRHPMEEEEVHPTVLEEVLPMESTKEDILLEDHLATVEMVDRLHREDQDLLLQTTQEA